MSTFSRVVFILQDPRPRLRTQGPLDVVSGGRCPTGQAAGGRTQPVLVRLLGDPRTGGRSRNASGAWDSGLRSSAKPGPCLLLTPAHPLPWGSVKPPPCVPRWVDSPSCVPRWVNSLFGMPRLVDLVTLQASSWTAVPCSPLPRPPLGGPDSVRMRSCGLMAAQPLPAWTAPHPRICGRGPGSLMDKW